MSVSKANWYGKTRWTRCAHVLLALVACCCYGTYVLADEPTPKQFAIQLFCPNKIPETLEFSAAATQETEDDFAPIDDPTAKPGTHQFTKSPPQIIDTQIEGTLEPLVLDSKGQIVKYSVKIKKFVRRAGKTELELLPAGSVVIADNTVKAPDGKAEETQYTLENGKLEEVTIDALQLVCFVVKPEAATDDEAFGTDAKQKVGATWAMNPAKAGKNPVLDTWSAAPEHAKGTVTLDSVDKVDGKDWIKVRIEATSDKSEPTTPGDTIEKANFHCKYVLATPLIPSIEGTYISDTGYETITKYANNAGYNRQTSKFHCEAHYTLPAPTK